MPALQGRLVDHEGKPIATVIRFVRVTAALSSGITAIKPENIKCVSRPDGAFNLPLEPGVWQMRINDIDSLQVTMPEGNGTYWPGQVMKPTVAPVPGAYLPIIGGTMLGPVILAGDPVGPLNPATRQWVEAGFAVLSHTHSFASLTGKPTTLAGYGIVDAAPLAHGHAWGDISKHGASLADLPSRNFSDLQTTPTTLAGYGITDAAPLVHTHSFASLTSKPTTLSGYGITDAAPLSHTHSFSSLTGLPTTLGGYGITDAEPSISAGTTGQYWRGDKSWQTLNKAAVGLGNVENTALSTWSGSSNVTTISWGITPSWTQSHLWVKPNVFSNNLEFWVAAESYPRFEAQVSGKMAWGAGAGSPDTNLYRSGAATLKTDGAFEVAGVLTVGGVKIIAGTGSPEGIHAAPCGSTFHRTDGSAGTSFYVKESGTGNTGWVAK